MGVRGLKNLMETAITDGAKCVKIEEQIRNYQKFKGETPLLVIDLQALAYNWSSVDNSSVGMRGNVVTRKATNFFERLKNFGAAMVFFDGGRVHKTKEKTFYDNRVESKKKKVAIVSDLESGMPTKELILKNKNNLRGSSTIVPLMKEIARKYGEIHAPVTAEKHTVMAALATEKRALAVLGNDTNFLVYCAKWRFWSLEDINFQTMVIKEYDTDAMQRFLNLNAIQMPLFATLAGNQIIPFEDFVGFHGKRGAKLRILHVAEFVRRQRFPLHFRAIEGIAKVVFRNKPNLEEYQNKITASLATYEWEEAITQEMERDPFLVKLMKEEWTDHYEILKNLPAVIMSSYVDVNGQGFEKPYRELALTLVKRHMGILWQHMKNPSLKREIFVSDSFEVDADYPTIQVPPLEKLIFRTEDDGLDSDRHRLLQFVVGPGLDVDKLFKLDPKLIPTVTMLYYFMKEAGMEIDEANIFLLSVYETMNEEEPKELQLPKKLNLRAFKIAFLFIKIQRIFLPILATLGFKNLAKHVPFDGLHFHLLWNEWENMDEKEKESRRNRIKDMCLYDN